jgi:sugar phosphate isomerase/epimerase
VGLTVDIAHMNTHGDPLTFLQALDPVWIYHVHLSDNAPHRVHLPLGDGEMELGVVLEAVAKVYQGIVSIEGSMLGQGEFLLQRNRDYLRKLGF